MTITETANAAVRYIRLQQGERICTQLGAREYERRLCERHCTGLDDFCVKRLLKYYRKQNK